MCRLCGEPIDPAAGTIHPGCESANHTGGHEAPRDVGLSPRPDTTPLGGKP
jgi:hypothetical protein